MSNHCATYVFWCASHYKEADEIICLFYLHFISQNEKVDLILQ